MELKVVKEKVINIDAYDVSEISFLIDDKKYHLVRSKDFFDFFKDRVAEIKDKRQPKTKEVVCVYCGMKYNRTNNSQKYCSDICQKAAKKLKKKLN